MLVVGMIYCKGKYIDQCRLNLLFILNSIHRTELLKNCLVQRQMILIHRLLILLYEALSKEGQGALSDMPVRMLQVLEGVIRKRSVL